VLVILAVIGGLWYCGKFDKILKRLPGKMTSTDVFGTNAWCYTPPTNNGFAGGFNQSAAGKVIIKNAQARTLASGLFIFR